MSSHCQPTQLHTSSLFQKHVKLSNYPKKRVRILFKNMFLKREIQREEAEGGGGGGVCVCTLCCGQDKDFVRTGFWVRSLPLSPIFYFIFFLNKIKNSH